MSDSAPADVRTHTITWHDAHDMGERARAMGGLAYLHAVMSRALPLPPIWALMGIRVAEAEAGHVHFVSEPQGMHLNPLGIVHGGFAATLLDSATGCAVWTAQTAGAAFTTLEIKVNYLRALRDGSGPVRAEGHLLHAGKRTALSEARLTDSDGTLCAYATSTCLLLPG